VLSRSETGNSFPTSLSGVSGFVNSSSTEHTIIESRVVNNSNFIVLLVSHDFINTFEFLEEDNNNSVNNFDIIGKSFNFTHVEFSVSGKFSLSFSNGGFSGVKVGEGFSFVFHGEDEVVFKFDEISSSFVLFNLESMNFFFGFLDISDGLSSGLNFGSDVISLHGVEMSFEFIKFDQ